MNWLLVSVDARPKAGGVAAFGHQLALSFTRDGDRVTFIAPLATGPHPWPSEYQVVIDYGAHPSRRGVLGTAYEDHRISRFFRPYLASADALLLIHPHYYAPVLCKMARARTLPTGVVVHGYELRSALLSARGSPRWFPQIVCGRSDRTLRLLRGVPRVFANSRYTAGLVASLGRKAVVTGCGLPVDTPLIAFDAEHKASMRRELGIGEAPLLTFLGRLVPSKSVGSLLDAVARLSDWQGAIVGTGPERAELQAVAHERGLPVHFPGHLSDIDKRRWLEASEVLLLPSHQTDDGAFEGFGIAVLEGLAAGASPVVRRSGGMVDAVLDGEAGVIWDGSTIDSLVQAVLLARSRGPELVAAGQPALAPAATASCESAGRFTWSRVGQTIRAAMTRP